VTGIEVIIRIFFDKVRKILPKIEDRGHYCFTNWRKKIRI